MHAAHEHPTLMAVAALKLITPWIGVVLAFLGELEPRSMAFLMKLEFARTSETCGEAMLSLAGSATLALAFRYFSLISPWKSKTGMHRFEARSSTPEQH